MSSLDYSVFVTTLAGEKTDLTAYKGKVLLIVNTASKCGFTPQYAGLQALHQEYADKGLAVLGFPCNQFGGQEPGTSQDIGEFCQVNYGVGFDMFEKVKVNGKETHPLFAQLKAAAPGVLGTEAIKWNFTKFLVARDGRIVRRFASATTPESLKPTIEELLAENA